METCRDVNRVKVCSEGIFPLELYKASPSPQLGFMVSMWMFRSPLGTLPSSIANFQVSDISRGGIHFFNIGNSIFHLRLELLKKFWKTSLKVA